MEKSFSSKIRQTNCVIHCIEFNTPEKLTCDTRPGLLEAWLVLTSIKYHGNLYILIPLSANQASNNRP